MEWYETAGRSFDFFLAYLKEKSETVKGLKNDTDFRDVIYDAEKIRENINKGNKEILNFFDTYFDLYNDAKGPFFWHRESSKRMEEDCKRFNILADLKKHVRKHVRRRV